MSGAWLRAGRVGRPHGLDGSFYVTEPKPQLLEIGRTVTLGGQMVQIVARKGTDRHPIVLLAGVADRAAAEELRGQQLLAPRDQAPALADDEWWEDDLEGCVVRAEGRTVGTVRRLVALPSCEALEVEQADERKAVLVPLVSGAVRTVDVERREIEIDLGFLGWQLS